MEAQLKVPDGIKLLSKESLVGLSPKEKDKYYERVVVDLLNANPFGVSALEIEKVTGFYNRTVREHLQGLERIGKAYTITRSGTAYYFPSGKPEDKELVIKSKAREGVFYVINKIAGQRGRFYYIQQKEMDEYRTLNVKGGILVSEEDAREFITQLHSYCAGGQKDE